MFIVMGIPSLTINQFSTSTADPISPQIRVNEHRIFLAVAIVPPNQGYEGLGIPDDNLTKLRLKKLINKHKHL
jgi:hypothetical protein